MKKFRHTFSAATVDFYVDADFKQIDKVIDKNKSIIITDENIFKAHTSKFKNWNVITLKPGEAFKVQATVDAVIEQLIEFKTDRKTMLVGVGGGVITDLTGYIASIYMRGLPFGFVPTSLLAMVDASIGGKNGIDVGEYKNMVGVIRQPSFLFYDLSFLKSLPGSEWSNGFAEIIKHASIVDKNLFSLLEKNNLSSVKRNKKLLQEIVLKNIKIKTGIVKKDEFEVGDRKLLNFGHTLGHALETQYELTHGQAISLGMVFAASISQKYLGFKEVSRIESTLLQYGLPTRADFDVDRVFKILQMDKKRVSKQINYVLLEKLGKAIIRQLEVESIKVDLTEYNKSNKH
jgi:3-dehydroquinate synthase